MMPVSSEHVAELRNAHLGMLRTEPDHQSVAQFIGRVARAGTYTGDEDDRQVLKKLLVHWTARAIRDGAMMLDAAPRLEPFDPEAQPDSAAQASETAEMAIPLPTAEEVELARTRVRIAATAEQWKKLGGDGNRDAQGYLLSGEALERARAHTGDSAAIAELVGASDRNLARSRIVTLRAWLGVAAVIGLLLVSVIFLIWQDKQAEKARAIARDIERVEQTRQAIESAAIALAENDQLKLQLSEANRRLQELTNEIDKRQAQSIPASEIAAALVQSPAQVAGTGPNTAFLGAEVALPVPVGKGAELSALNFSGFSILQGPDTRLPDVAYVWTDRSSRAFLDQINPANIIRDLPPPDGVPPERLADPMAFLRPGAVPIFLVNPADVAWGDAYPFVPASDAKTRRGQTFDALSRVAVKPNAVPVPQSVSLATWSELNEYALTGFAQGEGRIIVMSGPVKAPGDRVGGLWKVLVAGDPKALTQLQVEAFLIEPGRQVSTGMLAGRIRLGDLEKWIGLDFGEVLRASDTAPVHTPSRLPAPAYGPQIPDTPARLAARVAELDAPDEAQRKAAFTAIVNGFSGDGILARAPDREVVLDAVLAQLTPEAYAALSPDGRFNLVSLLAELPPAIWSDPGLVRPRAEARRMLHRLTGLGAQGEFGSFGQTAARIADAQAQLGDALTKDRTVYVQFAGFDRKDVAAMSEALRPLGWTMPGEERIRSAAGLNELRFHPDDTQAASLFLGDLSLVYETPVRPRSTQIVKSGIMELWISK
jgi:hypothetical protein